ncbi:PhzF family phenazine biosynthesis protein [Hafnia alvei]|uniref:PhzF family phenazine biosynthesis protein n=1 Tax=Hafnia alvei TaxID=569 RepID=A0ABD7Q0I5_HAFAL|nr:PhzF family phenazine biosynthesis protein [Hafnia alvei]TBL66389.1 PhzF family phenazine biosynthesis protein [Hafnia alvei]
MQIEIFQVDAFTARAFGGNPAAVCPLDEWLDDSTLQQIATENNLSETAFFVRNDEMIELRWFTPLVEVDLCGHATLATAWVLFNYFHEKSRVLNFSTRSGVLSVTRDGDFLAMDFPAKNPVQVDIPDGLAQALNLSVPIREIYKADDYIVLVDSPDDIENLEPDFSLLANYPVRGVVVTAAGSQFDFVSRWFGPNVGVNEDPVTGSAHTCLAPIWAEKMGKSILTAQQGGKRKGQLRCQLHTHANGESRVIISGQAVLYLHGTITV